MSETIIVTFLYEDCLRNADVKEIEGDFDDIFHVVMDDGYENNFFTSTDKPYEWYEENIGYTELAQSIGKAIEKVFYNSG